MQITLHVKLHIICKCMYVQYVIQLCVFICSNQLLQIRTYVVYNLVLCVLFAAVLFMYSF